MEDFRRREKAYESSIALYQKQISDSKRGAANDQDKVMADLRAQVADLGTRLAASEAQLASSQAEANALRSALAAAQAAAPGSAAQAPIPQPAQAEGLDKDVKAAALSAKARALDLLAYYLERIAAAGTKDGSK